jgi:3-methyladenine DNA glycosylase AlkD
MQPSEIQARLRALGSPEAAAFAARYFKTGPGGHGEGDVFLGLRAAVMHALAKEHWGLPLEHLVVLLRSEVHEDRMLALLILVHQANRGDDLARKQIYDLYLSHTRYVNNWDLVDASAPSILGGYLVNRSRRPLDRLARSKAIWERRISVIATLRFIRLGEFGDTLRIAERLLADKEDLIHKATGWMLREVGKRDQAVLANFLSQYSRVMPRTMLRYAIEHFPEPERKAILRGEFGS